MRVVIAPDKFKGCLGAAQVAQAIAQGARAADPGIELDLCPLADGGEGTVDALVAATGGRRITHPVMGPLPDLRVDAVFGMLGDGQTAVIEMAAASGLHLLRHDQRNPMRTTTYGTGQLLAAARDAGARRIILGIGGSATVDAGLGCAQACGARITLDDGTTRGPDDPPIRGGDLPRVAAVQPPPHHDVSITVACDVTNPLFGPSGAAVVFGPQKGADPEQVRRLDDALRQLAERLGRLEYAHRPGAGAAGGLGFALLALFGAELRSGIDIVIDAVNLRQRLRGADLCLTGEGQLDAQSLAGKTPVGVARLCKQLGVPCVALAGAIEPLPERACEEGITACFAIADRPMSLEQAMADSPRLLGQTSQNLIRLAKAARGAPLALAYARPMPEPPAGPIARAFYRLCYRLGRGVGMLSARRSR